MLGKDGYFGSYIRYMTLIVDYTLGYQLNMMFDAWL